MKIKKQIYSFQFLYRDNNGKLETHYVEHSTPLSKSAAQQRGKEYAKHNNMRFYQAIPKETNNDRL